MVGLARHIVPRKIQPRPLCERYLESLRREGRIQGGAFAGMRYITTSVCSANSPKWIGTYEMELRGIIERWRRLHFATIVDVGAAEGYYAIGCALAWPESQVIAFETEPAGRELISELIELNGLQSRVRIEGMCEPDDLARVLPPSGPTLVIMDVEGAENALLDPDRTAALKNCHILVEVHDFIDRQIADTLSRRFSHSHEIEEIWSRDRELKDYIWPHGLVYRCYLLRTLHAFSNEWRPGRMRWFAMTPRDS